MHFGHLADLAGPDHLGALPGPLVGIALVAHLRGDLVLVGRLQHLARFPDGAGERLLHVDVLAALHAPHGRGGVHEIGNRDDDGVDVIGLFVEHLAEIFILRDLVVLPLNLRAARSSSTSQSATIFSAEQPGCRCWLCRPRRSRRYSTFHWATCSRESAAKVRFRIHRSELRRPATARRRNIVWCNRMPR